MQQKVSTRRHFSVLTQCLRVLEISCTMPSGAIFCAAMNTDAKTTARRYYTLAGRDLGADLCALSTNPHGVVVWTPQLVVLMKPANSQQPHTWAELAENPAGADAWYVHLLVGNLALAMRLAHTVPAYPKLCFQRGLRSSAPHCCSWARILSFSKQSNVNNIFRLWDLQ